MKRSEVADWALTAALTAVLIFGALSIRALDNERRTMSAANELLRVEVDEAVVRNDQIALVNAAIARVETEQRHIKAKLDLGLGVLQAEGLLDAGNQGSR